MGVTSSSRSFPTPTERRLAVARILGAKGLGGAVRVEVLTDWPDRLEAGTELWLEGASTPMRVARVESGGRTPALHFAGLTTREAAEGLNGRYLEAPTHELPDGAYYWADLIGLRVEETDGTIVGELVEIFRTGGNEVYRITGARGERLVPALHATVLDIDLDAGRMVVAPDDAELLD
ncbi:MAG: ribosome maturation factor RimM [Candidatus Limnocylindria bacterium]